MVGTAFGLDMNKFRLCVDFSVCVASVQPYNKTMLKWSERVERSRDGFRQLKTEFQKLGAEFKARRTPKKSKSKPQLIKRVTPEMVQENFAKKRAVDPRLLPYIKINSGCDEKLCPVHAEYFDKFLPHGHPAMYSEFRKHPDCQCWMQNISEAQYQRECKK